MRHTVYGPGGFDPRHPHGNVVDEFEVDDPPAAPAAEDRLAVLLDSLAKATTLAQVRAAAKAAADT